MPTMASIEAGQRQREAPVQLDLGLDPVRLAARVSQQLAQCSCPPSASGVQEGGEASSACSPVGAMVSCATWSLPISWVE